MKFPSNVDWMNEYGMEELHRIHADFNRMSDKEDLAPDYMCALHVVDRFWGTVVPGIEKALKKM